MTSAPLSPAAITAMQSNIDQCHAAIFIVLSANVTVRVTLIRHVNTRGLIYKESYEFLKFVVSFS